MQAVHGQYSIECPRCIGCASIVTCLLPMDTNKKLNGQNSSRLCGMNCTAIEKNILCVSVELDRLEKRNNSSKTNVPTSLRSIQYRLYWGHLFYLICSSFCVYRVKPCTIENFAQQKIKLLSVYGNNKEYHNV